jgi:hypothetical protein
MLQIILPFRELISLIVGEEIRRMRRSHKSNQIVKEFTTKKISTGLNGTFSKREV